MRLEREVNAFGETREIERVRWLEVCGYLYTVYKALKFREDMSSFGRRFGAVLCRNRRTRDRIDP